MLCTLRPVFPGPRPQGAQHPSTPCPRQYGLSPQQSQLCESITSSSNKARAGETSKGQGETKGVAAAPRGFDTSGSEARTVHKDPLHHVRAAPRARAASRRRASGVGKDAPHRRSRAEKISGKQGDAFTASSSPRVLIANAARDHVPCAAAVYLV